MYLTLDTQRTPPFFMGGTMVLIVAPLPGMAQKPRFVETYEESEWRGSMGLLDFMRKTNKEGHIISWIKKEYVAKPRDCTLEEYARNYETFGEKVIAAEMLSMFNDRYYGQWMALNSPYVKLEDLLDPALVDVVPTRHICLASCLACAPEKLRNEAWVRDEMALNAHKNTYIENVWSMLKARDYLIQQYINGTLNKDSEVPDAEEYILGVTPSGDKVKFNRAQRKLEHQINLRVDQALAVRSARTDAEAEKLYTRAEEHGSSIVGYGPPGCGKTAVLDRCLRRALEKGARVALGLPTGIQNSRMRERYRDLEGLTIDTVHALCLFHRQLSEAIAIFEEYDIVFIDQAWQLFEQHLDRLDHMFLARGKVCALAFFGDSWQLPPPDSTQKSLSEHPRWGFVYKVELREVYRQDKADPLL